MSLAVHKSEYFKADFERQFAWYVEQADDAMAWRFQAALETTLFKLSKQPDLGRRRRFRHPALQKLRSFRVISPFRQLLVFYRTDNDVLQAWRLMHGSRDLPHRLLEPLLKVKPSVL